MLQIHSQIRPRWDLTPAEAEREQERLRRLLRSEPLKRTQVHLVAGCDVAMRGEHLTGGVVVFSFPKLEVVERASAVRRARVPYIPGLLSFRELPVLVDAFAKLHCRPDVVMCDGQGRAHPRHFGLACHLGVLFDVPSVGCAKSRLTGSHAEPGVRRGESAPLFEGRSVLGRVLRTKERVRPVYVSAGHRISLRDAVWITLKCDGGFRLPEPTRQADLWVGRLSR